MQADDTNLSVATRSDILARVAQTDEVPALRNCVVTLRALPGSQPIDAQRQPESGLETPVPNRSLQASDPHSRTQC